MTDSRWPTQLQAQLVATANGVDRANRPTLFVVLPAVAFVAAMIVMLLIWARFNIAREALRTQQRDLVSVQAIAGEIVTRRNARPDLATMFPRNTKFGDIIETAAKEVWPGQMDLPVVVGQPAGTTFWATQTELKKFDVVCSLRTVRLEQLTQWIDKVLRSQYLRGVFVSGLDLKPVASGWTGSVVFRRYEYDPNPTGQ